MTVVVPEIQKQSYLFNRNTKNYFLANKWLSPISQNIFRFAADITRDKV